MVVYSFLAPVEPEEGRMVHTGLVVHELSRSWSAGLRVCGDTYSTRGSLTSLGKKLK